MKTNKFTLMTVAVLGGLMAFAPITSVRADDPVLSNTNTAAGRGGERMKEFMEKLKLTPEQKPKFVAAMKSQREQMKTVRDDASLDADAKKAKAKKIVDATAAKLKTILNADQFATWEAGLKKMREGAANREDGIGGGTKPLPTTPTPEN